MLSPKKVKSFSKKKMMKSLKKKSDVKKEPNFQEMIDTGQAVYQKSDMPHHDKNFYDSIAFRNNAIDKILKINKKK